jgi:nicotinate-nucleotide adenylyltransferase
MVNKRRIGILGGTFNPVHLGHIDLGKQVRQAFQLDQILYILSAKPPHKKNHDLADQEIRWQMLNKALAPFPYLVPSDIEMKRPLESWTIDTVRQLKEQNLGHRFYFLSGSEGFLKIRSWKNYKELLRMLSFIILLRKESHKKDVQALLQGEGIETVDFNGSIEDESPGVPIYYLYSYVSDKLYISSTLIRQKAKSSESTDEMVHPEVKKIMEEKRLYEH